MSEFKWIDCDDVAEKEWQKRREELMADESILEDIVSDVFKDYVPFIEEVSPGMFQIDSGSVGEDGRRIIYLTGYDGAKAADQALRDEIEKNK